MKNASEASFQRSLVSFSRSAAKNSAQCDNRGAELRRAPVTGGRVASDVADNGRVVEGHERGARGERLLRMVLAIRIRRHAGVGRTGHDVIL